MCRADKGGPNAPADRGGEDRVLVVPRGSAFGARSHQGEVGDGGVREGKGGVREVEGEGEGGRVKEKQKLHQGSGKTSLRSTNPSPVRIPSSVLAHNNLK